MATTPNIGLSQPAHGGAVNTWDTDLNGNATILDNYLGVITTKAVGGVNITLSATEQQARAIRLTGTLSVNIQLIFTVAQGGAWIIDNATTGAFAVLVMTAGNAATGINVTQGFKTLVWTDGTTFRNANDVPPPVFVQAGASAATGSVPSPGAFAGPVPRMLGDTAAFVSQLSPPQGRLTLTSATPVTSSDVTAATTVYYTNAAGNLVPVYCGGYASPQVIMAPIAGGNASLTLNNPGHAASSLYDVFAFLDPADNLTFRVGTGPAWVSTSSRGSGAGTTELVMTNGVYMNAQSITLRNGVTTYAITAAGRATYLGTFRTTSSAGQTEDSAANRLLFNAYNAVSRALLKTESTATWKPGTASTWRYVNNNSANQVTAVNGLIGSAVNLTAVLAANNTAGLSAFVRVGIGINVSNASSTVVDLGSALNVADWHPLMAKYRTTAPLGYTAYTWLEWSTSASAAIDWQGNSSGGVAGISGVTMQ